MNQLSEHTYHTLTNEDTLVPCEKVSNRCSIVCVRENVLQNVYYEKVGASALLITRSTRVVGRECRIRKPINMHFVFYLDLRHSLEVTAREKKGEGRH